ncbi:bifunctional UDP-N-acetylglucosamine diphosphorylase/glucosamine-1-phosphate N-acetyltransferase GlmU [Polyangium spumosum]|uniref:Bifunctional protein GlmU n=1 Tax=Polyangium spumosum TaxID=889282 RepID=A0A6N7PZ43_9BACT|nr:bifunctional UDP-N-acetylglucosamine diphosphorylase/glucosamine-1-phosphate N-acetyltransferase GlmU [Polyangium spumosum]MRG93981.1 UDP-N-acetylglucosamine diphosphorylase/glucosamine-1-phosphate N-acetyltransferase [Polyangium spumosum]
MTTQAGSPLTAIVLAAGQGTRMKSARPKVLHALCGRPMVDYAIESALAAGCGDVVVVVGYGRDELAAHLEEAFGDRVRTAVQEQQRGTGDAVRSALPALDPAAERVLVLCGDTPLLDPAELVRLARSLEGGAPLAMLTAVTEDPTGYGRVLRDAGGNIAAVREHRDATEAERRVREVNTGVYVARASFLRESVAGLQPNNAQGELYLTDIVAIAAKAGGVASARAESAAALVGVNDRAQLAAAEDVLYGRIADRIRRAGATVRATARIDATVVVEPDAVIEHHVVLRGKTRIGANARIDVGSVLTDVEVAPSAVVKPYSVASDATIGENAQIGPFSHLRPESHIEAEAHIGNFVETKKTVVRRGAKANHLAYLGDGDIGEGANIGAGTIFCNYDGFKKHRTEIGPGAFIGSDSQIIAPVRIGAGAYVATGTTVTRDVPDDALAIGRVKQENKEGYASKLKARLKAGSLKKG